MSTTGLYRRIRRRETHAARAVPAITVAVVAIAALAWLVTETVIAAVGGTALLLSPAAMVQGVAGLPGAGQGPLVAGAVVLALVGLVLVLIALGRGRLGRHTIDDERAAVVVHDQVIASALVRAATDASGTDPDRAVASVGARRATVRITPTSGIAVDRQAVVEAVAERAASLRLTPPVRSRIVIGTKGRVGA